MIFVYNGTMRRIRATSLAPRPGRPRAARRCRVPHAACRMPHATCLRRAWSQRMCTAHARVRHVTQPSGIQQTSLHCGQLWFFKCMLAVKSPAHNKNWGHVALCTDVRCPIYHLSYSRLSCDKNKRWNYLFSIGEIICRSREITLRNALTRKTVHSDYRPNPVPLEWIIFNCKNETIWPFEPVVIQEVGI